MNQLPFPVVIDPERDLLANPLTLDEYAQAFVDAYLPANATCAPEVAVELARHGALVFMDGDAQKWTPASGSFKDDPSVRAVVTEQRGL